MNRNPDTHIRRELAGNSLDTADAVARAAHIWIRSLCMNELHAAGERHALAGGLVAGLCERLELDARVQELVTYVYALLNDEGGQALAISRMMHDQSISAFDFSAYQKGRSEAAGIVEMLTYHRNSGNHSGA
jgi:hypothetical protein